MFCQGGSNKRAYSMRHHSVSGASLGKLESGPPGTSTWTYQVNFVVHPVIHVPLCSLTRAGRHYFPNLLSCEIGKVIDLDFAQDVGRYAWESNAMYKKVQNEALHHTFTGHSPPLSIPHQVHVWVPCPAYRHSSVSLRMKQLPHFAAQNPYMVHAQLCLLSPVHVR
jgi:hypothetical protein